MISGFESAEGRTITSKNSGHLRQSNMRSNFILITHTNIHLMCLILFNKGCVYPLKFPNKINIGSL